MLDIRRINSDQAPLLVEIWTRTFMEAYSGLHTAENIRSYCRDNYTLEAATAALDDPDTHCRMAFRENSAVGFHLVKHHTCPKLPGEPASELKQIYVLASEYGSGLGRMLFDDACQCIATAGNRWVWLSVSDQNPRAQMFYRKLDFRPLGEGPVFMVGSDRLTSTIMGRKIGEI